MKYLKFLIIALTVFNIISCTEIIDIDVDDSFTRIVVDGAITSDTCSHKVMLTTTSDYFVNEQTPRVIDAKVYITTSENDTIFLSEDINEPGSYLTNPDVYGKPGVRYSLYIENVDIDKNGTTEVYTASSKMNTVAEIDSINLRLHDWTDLGIWEVRLYALDPIDENFYAFKLRRNSKLVTDTIDEISFSDDIYFNGNYTHGVGVQYMNPEFEDENFQIGDTIQIEMMGIDEEFYDFLVGLYEETTYSDPMFSGPPANITSNISGGGIGFFTAYSISRCSTIITERMTVKE